MSLEDLAIDEIHQACLAEIELDGDAAGVRELHALYEALRHDYVDYFRRWRADREVRR